jgi:ribosomal protein L21E
LTVNTSGLGTHVTNVYDGATVLGTATDATPYSDWFDTGDTVSLDIQSPITDGSTRFVFDKWSGSVTGSSQPTTVTMTGAKNITANYKTQYQVTFMQSGLDGTSTGTVVTIDPPIGSNIYKTEAQLGAGYTDWFYSGTTYSYSTPVSSSTTGKRFALIDVTGPTSPIATSGTVTGNYKTQYQLTVHTSGLGSHITNVYDGVTVLGTAKDATPYSGWFDAGDTVSLDIDSTITASTTRFVFTNWSGYGTGSAQPYSVDMTTNRDITANYKTQYKLTVHTSGLGSNWTNVYDGVAVLGMANDTTPYSDWFDEDYTVNLDIQSPITDGLGSTRFNFDHWSGNASGSDRPKSVTMTGAKNITANYDTQYRITFSQTGLDSSANSLVLTVDGNPVYFDDFIYVVWKDKNSYLNYTYESLVTSSTVNKRFVLVNVACPPSGTKITAPDDVVGNYKAQYKLTFKQTGLDGTALGTVVTVDGVAKDYGDLTPAGFTTDWYDNGDIINYTYTDPVPSSTDGKRFALNKVTADGTPFISPLTITQPLIITGDYKTQFRLTMATNFGDKGATTNPSVGEHWYNAGKKVYISASPPTLLLPGEWYSWDGWTGDGASSYTGGDNSHKIIMNSPVDETASWVYHSDETGPRLYKDVDGTMGNYGWYISDVDISLWATDWDLCHPTSGVNYIVYQVDGGAVIEVPIPADQPAPGQGPYVYPTPDSGLEWIVYLAKFLAGIPPDESPFPLDETVEIDITADGRITLYHEAFDVKGNDSEDGSDCLDPWNQYRVGDSQEIKIDQTDPELNKDFYTPVYDAEGAIIGWALAAEPNGNEGWWNTPVKFELTAYDATSGVYSIKYKVDGAPWQTDYSDGWVAWDQGPETFSTDQVDLTEGIYYLKHKAVDVAGNTGSEPEGFCQQVKVDWTPPDLVKDAVRTGLDEITVTLLGSDDSSPSGMNSGVDFIKYSTDGGATWTTVYSTRPPLGQGPEEFPTTFVLTGVGDYNLGHLVLDVAGNEYVLAPQTISIEGPGTTLPLPRLVITVDILGTLAEYGAYAEYPVSPEGRLLVNARTTSPDGKVTLVIPAGTLVLNPDGTPTYLNLDPDVFTIAAATPQPPAGYEMVAAYQFLPSGITFSPDANLIITYDEENIPEDSTAIIAFYDEAAGKWVEEETAGYVAADGTAVANTVTCSTAHFTYFAVLAKIAAAE